MLSCSHRHSNRSRSVLGMMVLACLAGFLTSACKPDAGGKRVYREVVITRPVEPQPAHFEGDGHDHSQHSQDKSLPDGHPPIGSGSSGMNASALPASMRSGAGVELAWVAPAAWTETAGTGMRRASFSADGSGIQCTIVALGGTAGGVESNIRRWLGQVNLQLDADALAALMAGMESGTTTSGLSWQWVDFNSQLKTPENPSMMAAILQKEGSTVFVKMTGTGSELAAQEAALRQLVESIR